MRGKYNDAYVTGDPLWYVSGDMKFTANSNNVDLIGTAG
jgi:hypothetical protein